MKATLILIVVLATLTGCASFREAYKDQAWTPDSFDYTNYRDRNMRQDQHGFGLSWSLK